MQLKSRQIKKILLSAYQRWAICVYGACYFPKERKLVATMGSLWDFVYTRKKTSVITGGQLDLAVSQAAYLLVYLLSQENAFDFLTAQELVDLKNQYRFCCCQKSIKYRRRVSKKKKYQVEIQLDNVVFSAPNPVFVFRVSGDVMNGGRSNILLLDDVSFYNPRQNDAVIDEQLTRWGLDLLAKIYKPKYILPVGFSDFRIDGRHFSNNRITGLVRVDDDYYTKANLGCVVAGQYDVALSQIMYVFVSRLIKEGMTGFLSFSEFASLMGDYRLVFSEKNLIYYPRRRIATGTEFPIELTLYRIDKKAGIAPRTTINVGGGLMRGMVKNIALSEVVEGQLDALRAKRSKNKE